MGADVRPATAVVVVVAVLAVVSVGSSAITEPAAGGHESTMDSIAVDGDDRRLWLYTSRGRSFETRTLAINVIVYGNPDDVRRRLLEAGRGDWNETDPEQQEVAPDEGPGAVNTTAVEWTVADGSRRYAYVVGPAGRGTWLTETYQVHDGDYLGSRHHLRAYTTPGGDSGWTAIQAHHEHWDWFSTRHVVTSVDESRAHLEREFADEPGRPEITRVPVGATNDAGFERWMTVIDFRGSDRLSVTAALILVLGAIRTRLSRAGESLGWHHADRDARALVLASGMVALVMAVRLSGVGLERSLDVPPKSIALLLYPALVGGLPACACLLAKRLDPAWAFGSASAGFVAAVLLDYTYLGVTHLPLDLLVHRGALAVALGLIAAASGESDRASETRVGVSLWLVATALPLLRHSPLPV